MESKHTLTRWHTTFQRPLILAKNFHEEFFIDVDIGHNVASEIRNLHTQIDNWRYRHDYRTGVCRTTAVDQQISKLIGPSKPCVGCIGDRAIGIFYDHPVRR